MVDAYHDLDEFQYADGAFWCRSHQRYEFKDGRVAPEMDEDVDEPAVV